MTNSYIVLTLTSFLASHFRQV